MDRYVPLLKGKQGEFGALKHLPLSKKAMVTPLLDIPQQSEEDDEPQAEETEQSSPKTLDEYLRRKVKYIENSWDCDAAFLVDFYDTDASTRTTTGEHPVSAMFSSLRKTEMRGIPVTSLDRDSAYQEAVRDVAAIDKRGACIRLSRDDLQSANELAQSLNRLLECIAVERASADLILDFRKIEPKEADPVCNTVAKILNGLPGVTEWRAVTFAGSSMPQSLASQVLPGTMGGIDRVELACWKKLRRNTLKRPPGFGDYGIVHPDLVYYEDPKTLNASATIRYTLVDRHLIARGFSLRAPAKGGFKQFYKLSRDIVDSEDFKGENFSWGDGEIERRSRRLGTTGNLTTWISIGTNHHLALVARQVAEEA